MEPLVEELKASFPSSLLVYKFFDHLISSLPFPIPDANSASDLSKLSQQPENVLMNDVLMNGTDNVPNNGELFGFSSTLSLSDILAPFAMRENAEQADGDLLCSQQKDVASSPSSLSSSDDTTSAYDILLDQLKRPESAGIVKSLQNFETSFKSRFPDTTTTGPELGQALEELVSRTILQLRPLMTLFSEWDVWPCAFEKALKTLLMHKLHDFAWGLTVDDEGDTALSNRLSSLSFLSFEHFDMSDLEEGSSKWVLAQEKLCKMNTMRTPCGKLDCLKDCLQLISQALGKTCPLETCEYGTDDFLPALIVLVISTNPPQLASSIEFLQCFHNHPTDVHHNGEEGYMLTLLVSAIQFLKNADANDLSIRPEDFEECMRVKRQNSPTLERTTTTPTSQIKKDYGMQGGIELIEEDELLNDVSTTVRSTQEVIPPLEMERVPALPLPRVEELKPSQVRLMKPVPSIQRRMTAKERPQPLYYHYRNEHQSTLSRLSFSNKPLREIHPSDLPALLEEYHSLLRICNELLEEKGGVVLGGGRHDI